MVYIFLQGGFYFMVEFITGQAGSGKTTSMFEKIKNNSGKQLVIVPEQYSYEFDKKLYFFLGAEKFNEILSLSFTSLARQLFQTYGEPNRKGEYADDYARMILIYQAISEAQKNTEMLNYFGKQSSYNGFAEEVLDLINDMKRSGISPEILMEKSSLLDKRLMDKTNDIAGIYLEYNRLMNEYGFKDNFENIIEAAKTAGREGFFNGMDIYIDEFESFTGDQLEMLKVMILSAENVYIALRTDDINAKEFSIFDTVNQTYRIIKQICDEFNIECRYEPHNEIWRFEHSDLEYLSRHVMRNFRYSPQDAPEPENIRIFEAKDMYSEVEYVCATIRHLISDDKTLNYRDFAILSNNIEEYADILRETFERCEIPYFMSISKPVVHTSIMVFFTSLLELLTAKKLKSEHIFCFMKCGILDFSLIDGGSDNENDSLSDIAQFENYCYKWNIEGDTWEKPFVTEDDNNEKFEKIRQFVIEPIRKLKKRLSEKNNTAADICRMLYEYLVECKAEISVNHIMGKLVNLDREYEAAELKRLWACIMDILDSITATIGEKVISFTEVSRIIRSMIGKLEYSVPPQTLDSVIAASARTARLSTRKIVFAIGSNDGDFPNQIGEHGIFSDMDKRKLAEIDIEISRSVSDLIASERLVVYKTLSYARQKLFVTYPLSDLEGESKYPAQVIDSIIKMFGDDGILITKEDISLDYYAVTLHSAFYHYMQNINVNNKYTSSIRKILINEPDYKKRIEYITDRYSHNQNYRISNDIMQSLESFNPLYISATDVESYNQCHFKYFCEHFMKIKNYHKIELDSRIAGDIIHYCFNEILKNTTKEAFVAMSAEELEKRIISCAEEYKNKNLAGDFSKDASFNFMLRKLLENLVIAFIHLQNEFMATSFRPEKYEENIRMDNFMNIGLENGYRLFFNGKIDRADTCTLDGKDYLRIIDYKSSQKKINAENLAGGINIQMLLYLFAVTEENGLFKDHAPAGVLYSPFYPSISKSTKDINSAMKSSGLVLGKYKVLDAMEAGVCGEFIPVQLTKEGKIHSKVNSCIASSGMEWLRDYTYRILVNMAESLMNGNVEAVPQYIGNYGPCEYCDYMNICDNSLLTRYRTPDDADIEEIQAVLDNRLDEQEEE